MYSYFKLSALSKLELFSMKKPWSTCKMCFYMGLMYQKKPIHERCPRNKMLFSIYRAENQIKPEKQMVIFYLDTQSHFSFEPPNGLFP